VTSRWRAVIAAMSTTPEPITCPVCKQEVSAAQLLDSCSRYWAALQLVHFTCPLCNAVTETQLRSGAIHMGYTYAAGTVHFCAMLELAVPGLDVRGGSDEVTAELGDRKWTVRA
jgi:hypothetical protein